MFSLLIVFHVIIAVVMIIIIMMQSGKGADMGAAFGGTGQANTARSALGAIGKVTTVVAILFMISSLSLAYMSSEKAGSSIAKDGYEVTEENNVDTSKSTKSENKASVDEKTKKPVQTEQTEVVKENEQTSNSEDLTEPVGAEQTEPVEENQQLNFLLHQVNKYHENYFCFKTR